MTGVATLPRGRMLALLGAAGALGGCGGPRTISIGAKDFTEELVLGELYAQTLERHGFHVTRKFELGGTQVAMEALLRGDIDLYPEYTGTALLSILKEHTIPDAAKLYAFVKRAYAERYPLTWLRAAPFDDPEALATTRAISARYRVTTLSELAPVASQLTLGAVPEFTTRPDGLPGLQRLYGGFRFKSVRLFDIGLKYRALESGQVDVAVAFGTDPQIESDRLVVFRDDKHLWPDYQAAPVVRNATLAAHPAIAQALDALAPRLTNTAMRRLNAAVDIDRRDPADAASAFLKGYVA